MGPRASGAPVVPPTTSSAMNYHRAYHGRFAPPSPYHGAGVSLPCTGNLPAIYHSSWVNLPRTGRFHPPAPQLPKFLFAPPDAPDRPFQRDRPPGHPLQGPQIAVSARDHPAGVKTVPPPRSGPYGDLSTGWHRGGSTRLARKEDTPVRPHSRRSSGHRAGRDARNRGRCHPTQGRLRLSASVMKQLDARPCLATRGRAVPQGSDTRALASASRR